MLPAGTIQVITRTERRPARTAGSALHNLSVNMRATSWQSSVGNLQRLFVGIGAPGSSDDQKLEMCLTPSELERVRAITRVGG
jgi:hypothetical protein